MQRLRSSTLFVCGLLPLTLAARADELPLAVPVEGPAFRASLAGADQAWNLQFAQQGEPRTVPAADLVTWGTFAEPARGIHVVLADGGIVVADTIQIADEQLTGTSTTFGQLSLPLELVAGVILRPPLAARARDQLLARIADPTARGDRLLLDNGDELSGTIDAIDNVRVVLAADGDDPWQVKRDTIRAIAFDPTLVDAPRAAGLRAVVGLEDGSRVTATSMITDDKQTRLKLPGGIELSAPQESVTALQVLGGRAVYLSDIKPAGYRHIPFLTLSWPFRNDRSVLDSQLRADGRLYLKGLGMHSPSRLTYNLDQPYQRFDAQLAIDDDARGRGSVRFRVFVDDGSGQWQPRAASEVVRGGQPPVPLSVDLSGAKRISLLVDYADRGDELDHADWLDARLVR